MLPSVRITGPVDPYFAAFVVPQSAGTAPPPLVVAPVAAAPVSGATVTLLVTGANKIQVIKCIREATGLGLKESLDLAESAPKLVKTGLTAEDADRLAASLRGAGATVEVVGGGASTPAADTPDPASARVALAVVGPNKIAVIKAVRECTGLGLRESLQIVEAAPQTIENLTPAAAQRLLQLLHEAGAAAQLA